MLIPIAIEELDGLVCEKFHKGPEDGEAMNR